MENSVKNEDAYNSFATIGSDHRIVSAKLRLSLRANEKTPVNKINYDWAKLKENSDIQERYTVAVKNRFYTLTAREETATERYERFIDANKEAARETLPEIKFAKKEPT